MGLSGLLRTMLAAGAGAVLVVGLVTTTPASAITNGQPDDGRHPYVGLLVFDVDGSPTWRCSGSLLSPTVVLTAGHCTDGATAARFWPGEDLTGNLEYPFGGATSYEGVPHTNPDYCASCGNGLTTFIHRDVGIVVLSEPVPSALVDAYASLPEAGAVEALPINATVQVVGYGVQEQIRGGGPPRWTGDLVRLFAPTTLSPDRSLLSGEFLRLSANPSQGTGGVCFGDSGGPALRGSTDVVLGVSSFVTNGNCAGVVYAQRIDIPEVLAWIEGFLAP